MWVDVSDKNWCNLVICAFKRADSEKILLGRKIQFSYLKGTKKERECSSMYVDVTCESFSSIEVFCNWFQPKEKNNSVVFFSTECF